jgi:hypothetical protein
MRAAGRRATLALAALLLAAAAKPVPEVIQGRFALPGEAPKATATLDAVPAGSPSQISGPGVPMTLDVTMTRIGAKNPIQDYDTELTKELHLIAVSGDLRSFIHVHGDAPDAKGRFHVPIRLPHSGFYWVFADATPAGLGQQVFRFDLRVGTARGSSAPAEGPPLPPPSLDATDGAYAVHLDPFTLAAGQETMLGLHILHNGQPALDVAPYLGVAAHAVFISVSDLSYTHVHAQVQGTQAQGTPAMGGMPGMNGAPPLTGRVPPDLVLHIEPPKPGVYRLWLQFMAAGQVRTVAFTVNVQ